MVGRARWRVRSELVLDELLTARVLRPCAGGRRGGKPTRRRGGAMVSKTGMLSLVKAFRWRDVDAGLRGDRHLLEFRDERGRNWLHICCATRVPEPRVKDSIKTAEVLLAQGLDIDREAFTEGTWKATPLWYAVSRGRNLALA